MAIERLFPRGRFAAVPSRAYMDSRLKSSHRDVLGCLATFTDWKGECYPSIATMMKNLGLARNTVVHALDKLEEYGYIHRTPRLKPDGSRSSNLYQIVYDSNLVPDDVQPYESNDEETHEETKVTPPPPPHRRAKKTPLPETFKADTDGVGEIIKALAGIVRWNPRSARHGKMLANAAMELLEHENFSIELLQKTYSKNGAWYTHDFRGQKGQYPEHINFIVDTWAKLTQPEMVGVNARSKEDLINADGSLNI